MEHKTTLLIVLILGMFLMGALYAYQTVTEMLKPTEQTEQNSLGTNQISMKALGIITEEEKNATIETKKLQSHNIISSNTNLIWNFSVIKQDELSANITEIDYDNNQTCFTINPFVYDEKTVNEKDYNYKLAVEYSEELALTSYKEVLYEEQTKDDISKNYTVCIPDHVKEFNLSIGNSSTVIVGSGDSDALYYAYSPNICRTSDGIRHIAYKSSGADLGYANSNDMINWYDTELIVATLSRPNIVCDPTDNVSIIYLDASNSDVYMIWTDSTSNYTSWSSPESIATLIYSYNFASCAAAIPTGWHCALFSTSGTVHYMNMSYHDIGVLHYAVDININTGDDTDSGQIVVADDGHWCFFGIGTDGDDLDVWCETTGLGSANRQSVNEGTGYSVFRGGSSAAYSIINGSGTFISLVRNSVPRVCKTSESDITDSSCTNYYTVGDTDLDANVGITPEDEIIIMSYLGSGAFPIHKYNSSFADFVSWNESTVQHGYTPQLRYSYYPENNRMVDGIVEYAWINGTNLMYSTFAYTPGLPSEIQCNCEEVAAGQIVCTGEGETNLTINGKHWTSIDVRECEVDIREQT